MSGQRGEMGDQKYTTKGERDSIGTGNESGRRGEDVETGEPITHIINLQSQREDI